MAAFVLVAMLGFKLDLWLVVGAWFAHGVCDVFHSHFSTKPGVPAW